MIVSATLSRSGDSLGATDHGGGGLVG